MSDRAELCLQVGQRAMVVAIATVFAASEWSLLGQDLLARSVMVPAYGHPLPGEQRRARRWAPHAQGVDRADVLVRLGEHAAALRATPLDPVAHFHQGVALERQGSARGSEHLRAAASLCGNRPALLMQLGDHHRASWSARADPEELLDAVACYKQAAARDVELVPAAIERLGLVLRDPVELAGVLPATTAARELLGQWYLDRHDSDAALLVIEAGPATDSASWQWLRGCCLRAQGDVDAALIAYASAVRLEPQPPAMVTALERELDDLPPARRAAFLESLADLGVRYQLAAARAHAAAGEHAAAMALAAVILRRYQSLALAVRRVTDLDVQLACHELCAEDAARCGQLRRAALEARAAAALDPTWQRLALAARRWRAAGELVEARACLAEARRAARAAGESAAVAELDRELDG
ncbi:MAG: hypothetical protein U1E76_19810 [Planctomycetota bacterium]